MATKPGESRDGVPLTNLDQPLFEGADATKRDLVDYVDALSDRLLPVLRNRPLSVIRAHRDQRPFMQKNVPKYAPDFVQTVTLWAESSKRDVAYALCNDRKTLLWFANQRAIEYHPTLVCADHLEHPTHLVLDLDPPEGDGLAAAVRVAHLVRATLDDAGLAGAAKLSGAKGLHIYVPLAAEVTLEDAAAATRAIAERAARRDPDIATTEFVKDDRGGRVFVDATRVGGATVVSAYSPRARAGTPVSYPVGWDELDQVSAADFTIKTVPALLGQSDPWAEHMPAAQSLPSDLVEEGQGIDGGRVQAMHEGKRRARARRASEAADE
jgi:DNA ligase D